MFLISKRNILLFFVACMGLSQVQVNAEEKIEASCTAIFQFQPGTILVDPGQAAVDEVVTKTVAFFNQYLPTYYSTFDSMTGSSGALSFDQATLTANVVGMTTIVFSSNAPDVNLAVQYLTSLVNGIIDQTIADQYLNQYVLQVCAAVGAPNCMFDTVAGVTYACTAELVTEAPATDAPAPATDAPATDAPATPVPVPDEPTTCFSEVATVQVEGKGPVAMKDLQVGDYIKTSVGESYEPVFAFGHYSPKTEAVFAQLVTEDSTLEMSGEHLVFVAGKANPVRADSIQVGDVLHPSAKVTQIGSVRREGLYAPLTESGTIVVDGVLASNYVSLQKEAEFIAVDTVTTSMSQHNFVHLMLAPFRVMCLGISSSMCGKYNAEGMPEFIGKAMEFQHWAESQNVLLQWLMLTAVIVCAGVCMILENAFGAAMGPTIVAATGAAYALFKATGLSVHATKSKTA